MKTFTNTLLVYACLVAASAAGPISLVSGRDAAQDPPTTGDGDSVAPLITPDGRYVLFASTANNLVPLKGGNAVPNQVVARLNVFRRDRSNGSTQLVSVNLSGNGGGDGNSLPTAISDDGRYALFESGADDLAPGDTNGVTDVFLRDMVSQATYLISVNTNQGAANGLSRGSTLTPDGRLVAFTSAANNLVANDTNGMPDVFVRDWQNGVTRLAAAGARATTPYSPLGAESPALSTNGQYVAFYSTATNLAPGITNPGEIYLCDLSAATTTLVSAGALETLGPTAISFNHSLSADGNFLAYEACTNPPLTSGVYQGTVFRFNRATGLTDTICTNAYAPAANPEDFHNLGISADGRFVVFVANAGAKLAAAVYQWDAQSGAATLVSGDLSNGVPTSGVCEWPAVDPGGRFVAFSSSEPGLVTNALSDGFHLYLRDTLSGAMTLLDADTNGVGTGVGAATLPQLSGDGRWIAFEAPDGNLVDGDRNRGMDVFVRDAVAGTNDLISPHDPAFPSATPNGLASLGRSCASADDRWVVFATDAETLAAGDTNRFRNIVVRDQLGESNLLVSVAPDGGSADGGSSEPTISGDGSVVVFTSAADNLVANDTNRAMDVFVRRLPAGPTRLVSVSADGSNSGNGDSGQARLSVDGRFVLFSSTAVNLTASRVVGGKPNLFLRDLPGGVTYALTTNGFNAAAMTPDGRWIAFEPDTATVALWDTPAAKRTKSVALGSAAWPDLALSPDGAKIICATGTPARLILVDLSAGTNGPLGANYLSYGTLSSALIGLRFSADSRFLTYASATAPSGTNHIHVYDFPDRTETLVSMANGTANGANANSDSPDISADGRYIAYRSFASNLVPGANSNGAPGLFLYDQLNHSNQLITTSALTGAMADNRSGTPVFRPDGHALYFESWASDLTSQDFNQSGDVFALPFLYLSIQSGNAPGAGPSLVWPNRAGETYHVQFKNDLSDPFWRELVGNVNTVGNRASFSDAAPAGFPRFYRVLTY